MKTHIFTFLSHNRLVHRNFFLPTVFHAVTRKEKYKLSIHMRRLKTKCCTDSMLNPLPNTQYCMKQ